MSLLADLLSKVKYQGHKKDVPPSLKRVITNSAGKEAVKKKIIVFSILVLVAIITGAGAVYFIELYIKPSTTKTEARRQRTEDKRQESGVKEESSDALPPESKPAEPPQLADNKKTQKAENRGLTSEQKKIAKSSLPTSKMEKEMSEPPVKKQEIEQKPKFEDTEKEARKTESAAPQSTTRTQQSERDVNLYTARTYESKKDYHHAFLNYKKALEVDPENYIIMNNISSVLLQMGSFEDAIKYSKNALSIKKGYVPSLINSGIAYIRLGNAAEGEGYLLKALSIEPSNTHALLNLGLLHERRGDMDKAYGYFFKLSEIGDIQGRLGIARVWERQGRVADAVRIYREIMSMNNIDPQIKKFANERLLQLGQ